MCEQTRVQNTGNDAKQPEDHVSSCDSGSIPEEEDGRLYNTCAVFGPDGEMILKHRKVTARRHGTLKELVFEMDG